MCSTHPFSRLKNLLWPLIQFPYSRRVFILEFQTQCAVTKSISILTVSFWASAKLGVEGDSQKPETWDFDPRSSCLWVFQLQQGTRQPCSEKQHSNMYMHSFLNLAESKISSFLGWQTNITHDFSWGFQHTFECNENTNASGTWLCKRSPSIIAPCAARKIACLLLNRKILQTYCQGWEKVFILGFYSTFSLDKDSVKL